jgi:DNA-binding MarR family transcriptional regulator
MSAPNTRTESEIGSQFAVDHNGCLFDPRVRELLNQSGNQLGAGAEALGAVRLLAKKLHGSMERWAEAHGLSDGRFQVLVRLQHMPEGRMTMGDIAEMLDVTPRTVTGLVDNLERDGLVRRVDDPRDRRSVYAELTDKGRERVQAVWRDAAAGQQALTRGFKESDLVQLRHLCLQLIQAINAEEGKTNASN